jgi:hypothetical protein
MRVDVIFLLILTAIIGGWGIWVSQRGEGRDAPRRDRRSTDARGGSDG